MQLIAQQASVVTAQQAAAQYNVQAVRTGDGDAYDYVAAQLTPYVRLVSGPLGTTLWVNEQPYCWAPTARDSDSNEKPMLYVRTVKKGDFTVCKGMRVTLQKYNEAVAAVLATV